jgi:hypothetical protein
MAATPDTIVLIHGFWVTPRSWEAIGPGAGAPRLGEAPTDSLSFTRTRGRSQDKAR